MMELVSNKIPRKMSEKIEPGKRDFAKNLSVKFDIVFQDPLFEF